MDRRRWCTGVTGAAAILATAAAAGATASVTITHTATAARTSHQAARLVRQFIAAHATGCPHAKIRRVTATPATAAEVTDTRPAGFDVTVELGKPASGPAAFLVSKGTVYPDNTVAGALALGCHRDPPAPKSALAWHSLPYLDLDGGTIQAGSDGPWRGARANPSLPKFRATFPEGNGRPVWGKTCSRAAQVVKFERVLYLLGRPDSLSFLLTAAIRGSHARPLRRIELLMNRRVVYRSAANVYYTAGQLNAAALSSIRFGKNTFEVVVAKPVSGPCNAKGAPAQYGVHFAIAGRFHADAAGASLPPTGTTRCAGTVCMGQASLPFTLTNQGPAVMLEPRLDLTLTFASSDQVQAPYFSATESGLSGVHCRFGRPGATRYRLFCDWEPMSAATTGRLTFDFPYKLVRSSSSSIVRQTWTLTWSFPGAYDNGAANAGTTRSIEVCAPVRKSCTAPISYRPVAGTA